MALQQRSELMRVTVLITAMLLGTAGMAAAQTQPAPAATNSGVLKRVPLDQWMPERCPNPERQGEIIVCGRPDEEPSVPPEEPVPGERGTDVQSERAALIAPESAAPSTSCTAVGAAGEFGCNRAAIEQWRRERALQKARQQRPDRE
jgi:hypothetical protein